MFLFFLPLASFVIRKQTNISSNVDINTFMITYENWLTNAPEGYGDKVICFMEFIVFNQKINTNINMFVKNFFGLTK